MIVEGAVKKAELESLVDPSGFPKCPVQREKRRSKKGRDSVEGGAVFDKITPSRVMEHQRKKALLQSHVSKAGPLPKSKGKGKGAKGAFSTRSPPTSGFPEGQRLKNVEGKQGERTGCQKRAPLSPAEKKKGGREVRRALNILNLGKNTGSLPSP